jgi:hypothetical protein
MRDTPYATQIAMAELQDTRSAAQPGSFLCIERLHVKSSGQDQVRFSWWKKDWQSGSYRLTPRPLDLPERELLALFDRAISNDVFSEDFLRDLRGLLADRAKSPTEGG